MGKPLTDNPDGALLEEAENWWTTSIIDVSPGRIAIRGYEIQELIGSITFADMIWLMLKGDLPTRAQSKLLDAALVSAVDHGPQAPSIAIARMAATCGVQMNSAMASGINVLGDVHGGAGEQCMELYNEISEALYAQRVAISSQDELARVTAGVVGDWRERGAKYLPGFGHRFHPVDPRVAPLLELADAAATSGVVSGHYAAIGRSVMAVLGRKRETPVAMNIDGATAVIYSELGFPPELGRGLFVLSRSVGILAHAWEQGTRGERLKGPMPRSLPYRYTGMSTRHLGEASA